ncbi:MAG: hypothetical protein JW941_00805 [Candidatus Coatesbacteria bacterium]|nr:hypothetical protein [Candidatus Coatesbacteria bacterium]
MHRSFESMLRPPRLTYLARARLLFGEGRSGEFEEAEQDDLVAFDRDELLWTLTVSRNSSKVSSGKDHTNLPNERPRERVWILRMRPIFHARAGLAIGMEFEQSQFLLRRAGKPTLTWFLCPDAPQYYPRDRLIFHQIR